MLYRAMLCLASPRFFRSTFISRLLTIKDHHEAEDDLRFA
jgi:hypothetical protein